MLGFINEMQKINCLAGTQAIFEINITIFYKLHIKCVLREKYPSFRLLATYIHFFILF